MSAQAERARRFLELHRGPRPLLLANAWDAGSAKLLTSLGFEALATTSSGHAATLGLGDGQVGREQALEHAAALSAATELPLSADLEDGFGLSAQDVARTVELACATGLAGCSIEDWRPDGLYELEHAAERVRAAAQAAHAGEARLVLTARAENHLRGVDDLADTITRLQAYQEAGADVLYAPGVTRLDEIRTLVAEVDLPVNVLALPGMPSVAELAAEGIARVSVGGAFAFAALGAAADAARELLEQGTYGFWDLASAGSAAARAAF